MTLKRYQLSVTVDVPDYMSDTEAEAVIKALAEEGFDQSRWLRDADVDIGRALLEQE